MPGGGRERPAGGQGRRGPRPPQAPRPDASPRRPVAWPPGQGCAAGAGVPSTRPTATPSGGGARVKGGLGLHSGGITMSPSAPEGLIPAGPRPGGETGLPRLPLPRSRPPQRPVGGSRGSADSSSHNAPPSPTRAAPAPHAARGPYPSPAGGPRTPGAPRPLSAPPQPRAGRSGRRGSGEAARGVPEARRRGRGAAGGRGDPRTSLCVWLLRAAAAAAAAAAAGPGHSCLSLAGREAEVQQQQLLNRQWLPPATHARTHTPPPPPLRPHPSPTRPGPTHPRSPPPAHLRGGREEDTGDPGKPTPLPTHSPTPAPPRDAREGARGGNFLSSGLGTRILGWRGQAVPRWGALGAIGTVWNRAVTRGSSFQ